MKLVDLITVDDDYDFVRKKHALNAELLFFLFLNLKLNLIEIDQIIDLTFLFSLFFTNHFLLFLKNK